MSSGRSGSKKEDEEVAGGTALLASLIIDILLAWYVLSPVFKSSMPAWLNMGVLPLWSLELLAIVSLLTTVIAVLKFLPRDWMGAALLPVISINLGAPAVDKAIILGLVAITLYLIFRESVIYASKRHGGAAIFAAVLAVGIALVFFGSTLLGVLVLLLFVFMIIIVVTHRRQEEDDEEA
jgi:hypothetical protein